MVVAYRQNSRVRTSCGCGIQSIWKICDIEQIKHWSQSCGTPELIFNCVTASPYLTLKVLCSRYDFMIAYKSDGKQLLIL